MSLSGKMRGFAAAYLVLATALTAAWFLLDQRLDEQTGLRRQVWPVSDFQGVPLINDIAPAGTLDFLEDDPRLPREFFSARWQGYWYVPSSQFVILHVEADDYANIWIDNELRFERSTAAARGIRPDAGVHELRIDYQQYGGAAHLSLLARRGDAYPRPFRTDYLFPDVPGPATLRLVAVVGWLRVVVPLTWIAGALALVMFRRRRTTTADDDRRSLHSATPYDAAALTALSLALLVYGYGNLSLSQSGADSLENLTLGIRLAQEGVYQQAPGQFGDHRREPFGPSLVAVADIAAGTLGRGALPSECLGESVSRGDSCQRGYVPYRALNLVLLLTGALGVFWLVLRLTGLRVLAYGGFLMTAQSAALLGNADSFLTEVHAAALILAVAALSWKTATSRRPVYASLLGLALAGLTLTKVAFAYLWIPIGLLLVASDYRQRRFGWSTVGLVSVLFLAQAVPVGGWMVRNYLTSGDFSISEARSAAVLRHRASFNTMRHDEWVAGFRYYLPATRPGQETAAPRSESYERFDNENEAGFWRTSRRDYPRRRAELWSDDNPTLAGLDELGKRRRVNDEMADEAMARLVADPFQHLKVGLLLAWRGVFAETGLGFLSDPLNRRLTDLAGRNDWLRWRHRYGPIGATLINLGGFLALVLAPVWLWLGRGQFEAILIFLPALYAHGAYAMATRFVPRFAEPQIPLRAAATMVLLYLIWTAILRMRSAHDTISRQ
ncbi:MAG: hypothetical protein F4Z04_07960 [Acidobacteria bacterium]|nr:hypothetical protein [Acidobacteriota bacterium]